MRKLIKINNQEQVNGIIQANFQENFMVEPESTISLLNMSCELEDGVYVVDDTNNEFNRSVIGAGAAAIWFPVQLTNGNYTLTDFLKELNRALNASLASISARVTELGFQFKVSVLDGKLKISFNRVSNNTPNRVFIGRTSWYDNTSIIGGNRIQKNAGVADGWNSAVLSSKFYTGGCGHFMLTRRNANIAVSDRVAVGLVNNSSQASYSGNYSPEQYAYCLFSSPSLVGGNNVYYYRYTDENGDPVLVETTKQVQTDEIMGIILTGGNLVFFTYTYGVVQYPYFSDLAPADIIYTMPWKYDKQLYGMISLYNQTKSVEEISFWNDPYHIVTNSYSHYLESEPEYNLRTEDIDDDPSLGAVSSVVQLDLTAPKDALKLLGFNANPPASGNVVSGYFQSDDDALDASLPQNMKVIIDNLVVDSTDNIVKQNQSILMTIPSLPTTQGKFIYNSNFLLDLSLKNKYPISLSEIRLRLLDYENNLISLKENKTDITLIISKK